jgi:pseudouridine kinase
VGRNVAEDIANVELRPKFVSMVDDTGSGEEGLRKLRKHKVNTDYVLTRPDGMGIWLAVFDESGDVVGSISKRPSMDAMVRLLDERATRYSPTQTA